MIKIIFGHGRQSKNAYSSDFQPVCCKTFELAIPDYLVRGTDLFSLRLSNKK